MLRRQRFPVSATTDSAFLTRVTGSPPPLPMQARRKLHAAVASVSLLAKFLENVRRSTAPVLNNTWRELLGESKIETKLG